MIFPYFCTKKTRMKLRNCKVTDYEQVIELLRRSWADAYGFIPQRDRESLLKTYYTKERFNLFLENELIECLVSEVEGTVVAWMRLEEIPSEREFHLSSIYVLPDSKGKGLGRKMIQYAFDKAVAKGYDKIWLGVMEQNVPALEWYKKLGFVFVKREPFNMGGTKVMHLIGYKEL
jgi:ribosomal protein S18 acetylase RimI-like enzyme